MKGKLTVKSVFDNNDVIEYATDATVGIQNGTLFISYSEDNASYENTTTKIGVSKDVVSLNRFGQFPAICLYFPILHVKYHHLIYLNLLYL